MGPSRIAKTGLVAATAWLILQLPAAALPLGELARAAQRAGIDVGVAVDTNLNAARQAIAASEFTSTTVENRLKWGSLSPAQGVYDFSGADALVDQAEQNGQRIRGHTLFWDRLNGMPGWLEADVAGATDPVAHLTQLMQTHAATVVGRYAGRLAQWDVVNEPLAQLLPTMDPESLFFQTLGESYLDVAFHAAHAADPTAQLFLNETLTEVPTRFDALLQIAQGMLDRAAPLHGIGLQGHFLLGPPDRTQLQSQLEAVAAMGLAVELTEVDISLNHFLGDPDPLAAQARAYADVFGACVAVTACTGVTVWGVDDGDTWLDTFALTAAGAPHRPLLFDAQGLPKPAYHAAVAALPEPSLGALLLLGGAALRRASAQGRARAESDRQRS
ncbi:MAG: 1,4-beta-xylanase [Deltaproteobacteria bacterium]|jgi:endo-1,4-beta-xylanase|nr:1,4-beta-xylanase [Deltaproteobacteria bacterium]